MTHCATSLVQSFHRAQVQQILVEHLRSPDQLLHFSKRLVSYFEPASTTEPIVLQFNDGTSATCDILVGSDGVRSAVRRKMYSELADAADGERGEELRAMIEPVWSGSVAYRGLIPANKLPDDVRLYCSETSIVSSCIRRVDMGHSIAEMICFCPKSVGKWKVCHSATAGFPLLPC